MEASNQRNYFENPIKWHQNHIKVIYRRLEGKQYFEQQSLMIRTTNMVSIENQGKNNEADLLKSIGLIRATWVDKSQKVKHLQIGNGMVVSEKIILTLLDNIYFSKLDKYADYVSFQQIGSESICREIEGYFYVIRVNPEQRSHKQEYSDQMVMIVLEKPIQSLDFCFPRLENISGQTSEKFINGRERQIRMLSCIVKSVAEENSVQWLKFNGFLGSINNQRIEYGLSLDRESFFGLSGCPIITYNSQNRYCIIGLHQRNTRESSIGVYFSNDMLEQIILRLLKLQIKNDFLEYIVGKEHIQRAKLRFYSQFLEFHQQMDQLYPKIHIICQSQENNEQKLQQGRSLSSLVCEKQGWLPISYGSNFYKNSLIHYISSQGFQEDQ